MVHFRAQRLAIRVLRMAVNPALTAISPRDLCGWLHPEICCGALTALAKGSCVCVYVLCAVVLLGAAGVSGTAAKLQRVEQAPDWLF